MGKYTNTKENQTFDILENDDDVELIIKAVESFRGFSDAINGILKKAGYKDDLKDNKLKRKFIKNIFDEKNIPIENRNLDNWLNDTTYMSNDSAIKFIFAFDMNLEETKDFFRRVCFRKGLDCHKINEAVYYYAIKTKISYVEANEMIDELNKYNESLNKENYATNSDDVYYTEFIIKDLNNIKTKEELYSYLKNNMYQFSYNNVTSYSIIKEMWKSIKEENGLAFYEQKILFLQDKKFDNIDFTFKDSVEHIFMQVLGLTDDFSGSGNEKIYEIKDRKISNILLNNKLVHKLVAKEFPNRQGLEHILNDNHNVKDEVIRKILILLSFYEFWLEKQIEKANYTFELLDESRDYINRRLIESGFLELYYGNPYDWLFLYSSVYDPKNYIFPLDRFRNFVREVWMLKDESIED